MRPPKPKFPLSITQVIVVFSNGSTLTMNKAAQQVCSSDLFGSTAFTFDKLDKELTQELKKRTK